MGRQKYREVLLKHSRDERVIRNLTAYLAGWRYHGEEVGDRVGNQRVLFRDEHGRWYAASIGTLMGSDTMITIVGSRRAGFLANRIHGLGNVVRREE